MSDEERKEYFQDIRNLCLASGKSVDMIAKKYNINYLLVLKLFLSTMDEIITKME